MFQRWKYFSIVSHQGFSYEMCQEVTSSKTRSDVCNLPAEKQSSGDCDSTELEDENEILMESLGCFALKLDLVVCTLYYIQCLKTRCLVGYY